jgi:hypothetical protein
MKLVVYIKDGCHLCEQMLDELGQMSLPGEMEIQTIVIDDNDQLMEKYGSKVPVLTYLEKEVCHYFLDPDALNQALASSPE